MINFNIKKEDDKVIAEYLLKANDRIDNLTLGMLVNNDIRGVVSVLPVQIDNDIFFKYDITDMLTMKEYLGEYVKKEDLLKVFYSVALAIKESAEYMINWTSFSLDLDEIYICKENGNAQLICLPILTVVNDGNLCNFFKNVLFSLQFELEENNDYVGRLINFLNVKTYSLDKFIYELEELLELEHIIDESVELQEADKDANAEKVSEEDVNTEKVSEEDLENKEDLENEEDLIEIIYDESEDDSMNVSKENAESQQISNEQNPFLVRVSDKERIVIDKDVFYVGSNETEVDYCIENNPTVSDKHAYFIRHGKEYFVVDNNTKGRTYLNRVEIQEDEDEVFIPHGAHISFGTEEFEFKMHE